MPSLRLRKRALLALVVASTLIGALCAKVNTSGNLQVGAATTRIMVDDPAPSIVERQALPQDFSNLQRRAELYARLMTTQPVLDGIARRAGIPADQLSGVARTTADIPITLVEPGSEERANQIEDSRRPYRLELQSSPYEPILSVYAQGPSVEAALRLADAARLGLGDYLAATARRQAADPGRMPELRQLGSARGGLTNGRATIVVGGLTFLTMFGLSFVVLLALARRRAPDPRPVVAAAPRSRLHGLAAGDWPRTTRILPWSVAGLVAMCWLVPFDRIELAVPTPIDMTLDRLVLPLIAVVWALAFLSGPGAAPRLWVTRVHMALGVLLACAFISVVLDARYLNQTGELMLAVKKLPLLVSYLSIFVIVASSIRPGEVRAFLNLTLVLSVICGLGVIMEYRFAFNPFFKITAAVLPPPFELVTESGSAIDALGRRWVQGPTAYGLEVIAMMTIALPTAILGILHAGSRTQKLLFGAAIVVLMAAIFATQRKSALVAPVAGILALAYFRRRELLSLAPLGLVLSVVVAAVSPGAVHNVVSQFVRSDATKVATVSDRTADYDAIRPDLWSHLLIGRGHGSYNHETYRILDSEILGKLVETGVLGLIAFLMLPISLILIARRAASVRDAVVAPVALTGIVAGVDFIVVSALYDVMSVPHAPFTFLYIAGLVAVATTAPAAPAEPPDEAAGDERDALVADLTPVARETRTPVVVG
jgi:hypothetical protein